MLDPKQVGSTHIIVLYLEQRVQDLETELKERNSKIQHLECSLWKLKDALENAGQHTGKSKDKVDVRLQAQIKKNQRMTDKLQKEVEAKDQLLRKILPMGDVASLFVESLPIHNALSYLQNKSFALWTEDNVKQVVKCISESLNSREVQTTARTDRKSSCGTYNSPNQSQLQDYKQPRRLHAAPIHQTKIRPTISLSQYTTDLLARIVKSDLREWGPAVTARSHSSSHHLRGVSRRFKLAG